MAYKKKPRHRDSPNRDSRDGRKRRDDTPKFDPTKPPRGRGSGGRGFGRGRDSGRDKPVEFTTVTCDKCQKRCEVPFKPSSHKPVLCSDCFKGDSGTPKGLTEINRKLDKIMKALQIN